MSIDPTTKPHLAAFIQAALNPFGDDISPEWGDGKFIEAVMKILEMLPTLFATCGMSKAAFVQAAQNPTIRQKLALRFECLDQSRAIDGLRLFQRRQAAAAAYQGALDTARASTTEELEGVHRDINELIAEMQSA